MKMKFEFKYYANMHTHTFSADVWKQLIGGPFDPSLTFNGYTLTVYDGLLLILPICCIYALSPPLTVTAERCVYVHRPRVDAVL